MLCNLIMCVGNTIIILNYASIHRINIQCIIAYTYISAINHTCTFNAEIDIF